ncbi:MAG: hypothetical protein HC881_19780 [Leptolyngbyaceae cyanobacterium SL_7_1]|nr:hypothetical protein [Leptolyngbyaceae cyanobacterium SL_7_1]
MSRGDQIYVMRPFVGLDGLYEHHGIDCGDGTVIHYSKAPEPATIRRTSMAAFAMGNPVFVKPQPVGYIPDVVIERAERRLGEQRYELLSNNCEHFATWCKTGQNASQQLVNVGFDGAQISAPAVRELMEDAAQGDLIQATALLKRALSNTAIAQTQLQQQYDATRAEISTWHRVAQLALKQGREDLARAALERKVEFKRKATDLEGHLGHLAELQMTLDRNSLQLKQQASI